jgi:hypothetical protein
MDSLKQKNAHAPTVGNMRTNVRGDLLGKNGKVIKTKEQLATEKYDKKRTKTVSKSAALNAPLDEMLGGKKKKPVRFIDEVKNKTDIETLGKYDLGEAMKE